MQYFLGRPPKLLVDTVVVNRTKMETEDLSFPPGSPITFVMVGLSYHLCRPQKVLMETLDLG